MKAIERAKTHFAQQDVKVIKVPEWGEEDSPLEIYAKPLTLSETSKLYKMSKNDDLTMMAYVLMGMMGVHTKPWLTARPVLASIQP